MSPTPLSANGSAGGGLGAFPAALLALLCAALVAGAAALGGGTVPAARAALPGAAAALAVAGALAGAGRVSLRWSAGERWLLALAAWAALTALPWPAGVARVLAPWSFSLRAEGLGVAGGVRPSLDAGATWGAALVVGGLAALSWAARTACESGAGAWLQRGLCLAAAAHAAVGLAHGRYAEDDLLLGGHPLRNALNAYGTFANQGQFAAFLLLATGSAALRWRGGRWFDRALAVGTLGVVGAAVAASRSRAGTLGLAAGLAWAFVAAGAPGRRGRRLAAVAALSAALVGARLAGFEPLVRATTPKPGEARRLQIWRGALSVAAEQPVVGVGAGAFGDAYSDASRPLSDRAVETAEDQALEWLAEGGAVGAALLLGGGAALLLGGRRRRRAASPEGRARLAVGGATLAALVPPLVTGAPFHAPAIAAGAVLAWHATVTGESAPARDRGYPPQPEGA